MGLLAGALFSSSAVWFAKDKAVWRFLQLFGSACIIVVVLTHVAETLVLIPSMGWGLPNSFGHYLDFVSAILGLTLVPVGILADAITRRKNSN
jgi:formate hydrogenlyase subunit 3/multisubunit Na+/H+ antiporter MnhD subunit